MTEVQGGSGAGEKRLNLRFELAHDLFDGIPEIAEDVTARPEGGTSIDFIKSLASGETPEEALTVCAYSLPKRHAVWWGHECLQRVRDTLGPSDHTLLELAAAWVADPTEDTRRAALVAAEAEENPGAGAWIAYAAAWSGGSMTGPDMPEVSPPPSLTAKAVNAGVLTALAGVDVESRDAMLGSFVRMALQLAEDG